VAAGGGPRYDDIMTQFLTRRGLLAFSAAGMLATPARAKQAQPVILELFTSQGCSSCPAADALFQKLARKRELVALSYHIDYWDYLGWRDTLGSADFSQRQYDYAKSRGDMDVYTPQMVIDGGAHCVGSHQGKVAGAIEDSRRNGPSAWVDLAMSDTKADITIDAGAGDAPGEATLWLMAVMESATIAIKKGENAGTSVVYKNVVRKMTPAGLWKGDAAHVVLPKASVVPETCTGWVALLQKGKVGPVIGAAVGGTLAS
jgi:hypothetical protein